MRRLAPLLLLLCIGCSKPGIVGKWRTTITTQRMSGASEVSFDANGSFVDVTTLSGSSGGTLQATDRGTWKMEGDKITTKTEDVDWQFPGAKPELAAKARQRFLANKASIITEANRDATDRIVWSGTDQFTLTSSKGETHTYSRVK